MATTSAVPFSARHAGTRGQIDRDFPKSGRVALIHLLFNLVEKRYANGWPTVARELQRIARMPPVEYQETTSGEHEAQADSQRILGELPWEKVFDFCERLHGYLAQEVGSYVDYDYTVTTTRKDVQAAISLELERIFLEERLAFQFRDGVVERRGRRHTVESISRAETVLGDPRLINARKHYGKALHFFRHPSKPDFENVVKEAVCSVEAAGKALFPDAKAATLGDLTKWLIATEAKLPKALAQTFSGLYGFRSGGDGVGHGGSSGGEATQYVAEYVLAVAASQIIYLVDLANAQETDIPF